MQLAKSIKNVGLAKFYLKLPLAEKKLFSQFYLNGVAPFQINSPTRLLWVTAANLIPQAHWAFAEKLLLHALDLAKLESITIHLANPELATTEATVDLAHIHANFAQLYADQVADNPDYLVKCLFHARETIKTGYFVAWAEGLCQEVERTVKSAAELGQ